MPDFEAVPARLSRAGHHCRDLVEIFTRQPALGFKATASEAGDPVLAKALESFQQASAHSIAVLAEDTRRLGDRLDEAARRYRSIEDEALGNVETIEATEGQVRPAAVVLDTNVIQAVLG
ncbi:hypothetical protein [Amycolatopsis sp. NPDC051071]|uniref:hypothetical protein n=1 Tax=Amycolatopsis sp. NPDC051071 TaxID=3154637 RepID=UPI00341EB371